VDPIADSPRRRRGDELENALLDAAWQELSEGGYGTFTIDAVAERAHTSRPVLYRRWATRDDLLLAAIRHGLRPVPVPTPDTGSLRGDLLAIMMAANDARRDIAALISVHLGSYYQATGLAPADLRELLLEGRPSSVEAIMERGIERGEIDPARLTARVATLPFDLLRHELIMTLKPIPESVMLEIVDDIFLPMVRPRP
jgi:AcrR family transcriptional regulator